MIFKTARIIIILVCAVLVFLSAYPVATQSGRNKELVVQETLQCISSVCVHDERIGLECRYMDPSVSRVVISVDNSNNSHRVVTVEKTDTACR